MTGGGRQGKKAKMDDSVFPVKRGRVSKLVLSRAGLRPIYHELISGSVLGISTISDPRLGNKSSAMLVSDRSGQMVRWLTPDLV